MPTAPERRLEAWLCVEKSAAVLRRLGLESYKTTDCIGTVSEARLAFAMCRARVMSGNIDVTLARMRFAARLTDGGVRSAGPSQFAQRPAGVPDLRHVTDLVAVERHHV